MNNLLAIILVQQTVQRIVPTLIMITSFMAIFYFLLLRPQKKAADQHRALLQSLKKGDEVITEGGIIGQIVHLADDRVTIRSAENTRLVVARNKIARVTTAEAASEAK